ncbi:MAG: PfkB family carbohydrate kinase [Planctomycetota bacterium]
MPVRTADFDQERLLHAASRLDGTCIGVVGDFGADVFIYGRPGRLSREAPVPILDYEDRCTVPGMAGNVVRNLSALGAEVRCAGMLGRDDAGRRVREKLNDGRTSSDHLLLAEGRRTCTKTRIMAGGSQRPKQQLVRLDRRDAGQFATDLHSRLLDNIEDMVEELDALIVSDYGIGTVGERLIERIPRWAEDTKVIVDSRYRLGTFRGATAATPNQGEFEDCMGRQFDDEAAVADAASELRNRLEMEALLVTRGNEGMLLTERNSQPVSFPIVGREDVTDVTGAGDTVVAAFALACGSGAGYAEAAFLATHAAGVVVTKPRTATCHIEELRESITEAHLQ